MIWHLIARIGSDDTYTPKLSLEEPRVHVSIDVPGDAAAIRSNVLREISNKVLLNPSSHVIDLLNLAFSVYAADLKIPRNLSEDRWTRDVVIHLPVVNLELWTANHSLIKDMLDFLTGDRWEIRFRACMTYKECNVASTTIHAVDTVSLFSGGLDSLIGAIDLLEAGKKVALVSHYGSGITNSVQQNVLSKLKAEYGERVTSYSFGVQPMKKRTGRGEPSMRSRSILFIAMGTFIATLFPENIPLVVAENGLISLNIPLTNARIGSLSTRTTHPHFIALYQCLLDSIGLRSQVETPYQFHTKGEMCAQVNNYQLLTDLVEHTMSCSHPESGRYLRNSPNNHCGYCVPCIIRRAALASVGLDIGKYNIDILKDQPSHTMSRGRDFRAFQMAIERYQQSNARVSPFTVLRSGSLSPDRIKDYMEMYERGMEEVNEFLQPILV
jgi:7-cyano-7-deazaguanine synthase in queuosine biosynthesis